MDAPVERDVKLQKASADLLADIHTSLPTFLRKPSSPSNCIGRVRQKVRVRETLRIINLASESNAPRIHNSLLTVHETAGTLSGMASIAGPPPVSSTVFPRYGLRRYPRLPWGTCLAGKLEGYNRRPICNDPVAPRDLQDIIRLL